MGGGIAVLEQSDLLSKLFHRIVTRMRIRCLSGIQSSSSAESEMSKSAEKVRKRREHVPTRTNGKCRSIHFRLNLIDFRL